MSLGRKEYTSWKLCPVAKTAEDSQGLFEQFPELLPWCQQHFFSRFSGEAWAWTWQPGSRQQLGLVSYPVTEERSRPLLLASPMNHRGPSGPDPLMKAIWGKKYSERQRPPLLVDGTAGLLGDALRLDLYGDEVWLFEQNPCLQVLIQHYLLYVQPIAFSKLRWGGRTLLSELREGTWKPQKEWILYLDPMFHAEEKSAAKWDLERIKDLTLGDPAVNWEELWEERKHLQSQGLEKIVVKRWPKAPTLWGGVPTYEVHSKLLRFDVYQL